MCIYFEYMDLWWGIMDQLPSWSPSHPSWRQHTVGRFINNIEASLPVYMGITQRASFNGLLSHPGKRSCPPKGDKKREVSIWRENFSKRGFPYHRHMGFLSSIIVTVVTSCDSCHLSSSSSLSVVILVTYLCQASSRQHRSSCRSPGEKT